MGSTFIPLLKRDTIGLVNGRASIDHFLPHQLESSFILINEDQQGMTYRFMRYPSQSFLLLSSFVQYKSDDKDDDQSDNDPDNKTCEFTFSEL